MMWREENRNVAIKMILTIIISSALIFSYAQDMQADNMLLYQRAVGGWPKHISDVKVDYTKALYDEDKFDIKSDSLHNDATIDNGATVKEIRYLAAAYKKYKNAAYLAASEKGIRYLLKAQYAIGGWPQFYPDSSLYRGQITYNDNAIANVLNLFMDVKMGVADMDVINRTYVPSLDDAVKRGIQCILLTQIKVNGKLTAWCAQYNQKTLKPEMARKFELASLSGMESVSLTEFLMRQPNPTPEIKLAISSAVDWFKKSKIDGFRYEDVKDPAQPNGRDRILIADPASTVWARFYDIETNQPFFSGRDSKKHWKLAEIENERRTGYAWYGTWPKKLLEKEYPKWILKNE